MRKSGEKILMNEKWEMSLFIDLMVTFGIDVFLKY